MTRFEFGTIILVRFPFTDLAGSKKQPAVIISNQAYNATMPDVVAMPITSKSPGFGELLISDWKGSGLIKPSAIKLLFATIDQVLIERSMGILDDGTKAAIMKAIREILG
jgi:mRNA interferase MazF